MDIEKIYNDKTKISFSLWRFNQKPLSDNPAAFIYIHTKGI